MVRNETTQGVYLGQTVHGVGKRPKTPSSSICGHFLLSNDQRGLFGGPIESGKDQNKKHIDNRKPGGSVLVPWKKNRRTRRRCQGMGLLEHAEGSRCRQQRSFGYIGTLLAFAAAQMAPLRASCHGSREAFTGTTLGRAVVVH